jgi:hypothetical protein
MRDELRLSILQQALRTPRGLRALLQAEGKPQVKKEVAEDPERLGQMVLTLAEALGAETFASLFDVEQSLTPTKAYTESSCQLPAQTRAALNLTGVRQIVALAAK